MHSMAPMLGPPAAMARPRRAPPATVCSHRGTYPPPPTTPHRHTRQRERELVTGRPAASPAGWRPAEWAGAHAAYRGGGRATRRRTNQKSAAAEETGVVLSTPLAARPREGAHVPRVTARHVCPAGVQREVAGLMLDPSHVRRRRRWRQLAWGVGRIWESRRCRPAGDSSRVWSSAARTGCCPGGARRWEESW